MLGRSAHIDTFARDNLPPVAALPDFLLDGFHYPDRLNVGVELSVGVEFKHRVANLDVGIEFQRRGRIWMSGSNLNVGVEF